MTKEELLKKLEECEVWIKGYKDAERFCINWIADYEMRTGNLIPYIGQPERIKQKYREILYKKEELLKKLKEQQ